MVDILLLWLSLYISSVEEVVVGRVLLSVRVKARGVGGESAVECTCES